MLRGKGRGRTRGLLGLGDATSHWQYQASTASSLYPETTTPAGAATTKRETLTFVVIDILGREGQYAIVPFPKTYKASIGHTHVQRRLTYGC